jgi:DNA-binding PadR family transcriptional regulator
MEPIKRFVSSMTDGNLWIYILSLGKEIEIQDKEVAQLVFEKFGFLPNGLMVMTVLFRLRNDGYISKEKFKGEKAYKVTEKGLKELEAAKNACQSLLEKI